MKMTHPAVRAAGRSAAGFGAINARSNVMTINEGLRAIAGVFVLVSVALGLWVNPWFFAFSAFVGANLLQSAFSHWCPMMWVLKRAGLREG
jgi:DUF2892 family protein